MSDLDTSTMDAIGLMMHAEVDRIIAALDRPAFEEAHALADKLDEAAPWSPFPEHENLMKRAAAALRAGKQTP